MFRISADAAREVSSLSDAEKLEFAEAIFSQVQGGDPSWEKEIRDEANRRAQALGSGLIGSRPINDVFAELI